jgi:hypothetical protein
MGGIGGGGALDDDDAAEEGTEVTVMVNGGFEDEEVGGWFEGAGAPLCTWARNNGWRVAPGGGKCDGGC